MRLLIVFLFPILLEKKFLKFPEIFSIRGWIHHPCGNVTREGPDNMQLTLSWKATPPGAKTGTQWCLQLSLSVVPRPTPTCMLWIRLVFCGTFSAAQRKLFSQLRSTFHYFSRPAGSRMLKAVVVSTLNVDVSMLGAM
jgi:hypothetical protein